MTAPGSTLTSTCLCSLHRFSACLCHSPRSLFTPNLEDYSLPSLPYTLAALLLFNLLCSLTTLFNDFTSLAVVEACWVQRIASGDPLEAKAMKQKVCVRVSPLTHIVIYCDLNLSRHSVTAGGEGARSRLSVLSA